MGNNQLDQLIKIFNTLGTISTKGEDTIIMAECLKALRQYIVGQQNQTIEQDNIIAESSVYHDE